MWMWATIRSFTVVELALLFGRSLKCDRISLGAIKSRELHEKG